MDWVDPTLEEVKAIDEEFDFPIVGIIKALSSEERKLISDSLLFKPDFRGDYLKRQEKWINDFKWFWSKNHNGSLESSCCNDDLLKSRELERYRLFYAAKYPERMDIIHPNERTSRFLEETTYAVRIIRDYIEMKKMMK
jgi:hypothetical protein